MAEYHLHAKTHSRGVGKGAGGHVRYILREGAYAKKTVKQVDGSVVTRQRVSRADEVLYSESDNMPSWAKVPADYWDAADEYERANGTVYREIEFALPSELSNLENIGLARAFAEHLADVPGGQTPYTFSIHKSERDPSLLHCHLMLSDKVNDGIDRDSALWFKRAATSPKNKNPVDPARGGAPKTQVRIGQDWLSAVVRPLWERLANDALSHAKVDARIDRRTLEARRIEQERLAEEAHERGDDVAAARHLQMAVELDRPPKPKKGRVLTHGGSEKAPDRAGMVVDYEAAKAERAQAVQLAAQARLEAMRVETALRAAEAIMECAGLRHAQRDAPAIQERWQARQVERATCRKRGAILERAGLRHAQRDAPAIQERWSFRQQERERRLKREAIMERAQLRHGYRMDSSEIRERWSFRQQEREMEREADRLLEEQEAERYALEVRRQELTEEADADLENLRKEAPTVDGIRPVGYQREHWLAWRKDVLERRYDPEFSRRMIEEQDVYCRWRKDYGGLHLVGLHGTAGAGIVDTGPMLKLPPPLDGKQVRYTSADLVLMVETAKAKGWSKVQLSGSPDFQFAFAKVAVEAGLHLSDSDLEARAYEATMPTLPNQQAREDDDDAKRTRPRGRGPGSGLGD